jgi:hypothetical protein
VNRRGADGARKRGDPETMANAEINLADLLLAQGRLSRPRRSSTRSTGS